MSKRSKPPENTSQVHVKKALPSASEAASSPSKSISQLVRSGRLLVPMSGSVTSLIYEARPTLFVSDFGYISTTIDLFMRLIEDRLRKPLSTYTSHPVALNKAISKTKLDLSSTDIALTIGLPKNTAVSHYATLLTDSGLLALKEGQKGKYIITEKGFSAYQAETTERSRGITPSLVYSRLLESKKLKQ